MQIIITLCDVTSNDILYEAQLSSRFGFASLSFSADALSKPTLQVVGQIVARVNGDTVSQDELEQFARELSRHLQAQGATPLQIQQKVERERKDAHRERMDELSL